MLTSLLSQHLESDSRPFDRRLIEEDKTRGLKAHDRLARMDLDVPPFSDVGACAPQGYQRLFSNASPP